MSNILSRIQEIALNEGITIGALERQIGASKGVLSRAISNGTDIQSKWIQIIVENYPNYSTRWLLTGGGSMLHDDKTSLESNIKEISSNTTLTLSEESIIYKMYQTEKEDWKAEKREQDAKIDKLHIELRLIEKELAETKARLLQYEPKTKESKEHPKGLGTAKNASTKKPSSQDADNATSATAR